MLLGADNFQSVHEYNGDSAILHLKGRYPDTSASSGDANVNVNNVLDSLNVEMIQVGSWVNVIGYMRRIDGSKSVSKPQGCAVDAVLVWSAGAIKLDDYEAAVKTLQDTTS